MAITDSIDDAIAELISKLPHADSKEASRIHCRLEELEKLKEQYGTA